jgi:hypothetical protein
MIKLTHDQIYWICYWAYCFITSIIFAIRNNKLYKTGDSCEKTDFGLCFIFFFVAPILPFCYLLTNMIIIYGKKDKK